ncbi:MAG TPA: PTS system mannose/fructose/sorbose family transporter subunit IID [Anaeromyxobacteraceae bacterium]|nr:PTS system mannose/fructose/sorbose family transporter subunit IID [Anaeromyxobacteraceae bacterium]
MTRVSSAARTRAFLRSLLLQAAWNRRGMQNLGFEYAIAPALDELYPDPERRRDAAARHLGFFNCHPYMAAAILGGAIHHEERVARGEESPATPQRYKQTLQGPLAAIGDGFFWTALRPFFGAVAALGALLFGWPAVLLAITIYNAIHLALRVHMFRAGYRQGDAVIGAIAAMSLPSAAERLRLGTAAFCGVAAAAFLVDGAQALGPIATALALAAAIAGQIALRSGASVLAVAYGVLLVTTGAGLVALRLPGGS